MEDSDIDSEAHSMYRRYKAVQSMNKGEVKDLDEVLKKFHNNAKAFALGDT